MREKLQRIGRSIIVFLLLVIASVAIAASIMLMKKNASKDANENVKVESVEEKTTEETIEETTEETTEETIEETTEEETTEADSDKIVPGTNKSNAFLIPLGTKVFGTIQSRGTAWFSFTTGETAGATYNVTFVNCTANARNIYGYIYDEYGTKVVDTNNNNQAEKNGIPVTLSSDKLEPNTTYYVALMSDSVNEENPVNYTVKIKSPEEKKEEKTELVFEVPFEINETQVQFVKNEAVFVDESKANEAVKPVAEAVLNAPEHAILIAGTTATDGTQESCIDLSNRRAEAVKNLLVNTYKVPESQIKTVGLGYEADPFERGADRDSSGKFVESEAKKNRRVVILDLSDPIAQQLLSK